MSLVRWYAAAVANAVAVGWCRLYTFSGSYFPISFSFRSLVDLRAFRSTVYCYHVSRELSARRWIHDLHIHQIDVGRMCEGDVCCFVLNGLVVVGWLFIRSYGRSLFRPIET